jgi:hypothetical protein
MPDKGSTSGEFWLEGEYEGMTGTSVVVLVMLRTDRERELNVRVEIPYTQNSPLVSLLREKRKCLIRFTTNDCNQIQNGAPLILTKTGDDILN